MHAPHDLPEDVEGVYCVAHEVGVLGRLGPRRAEHQSVLERVHPGELQPPQPRPRIALVLDPGGPRGYAHIGVLRVLEEAGIQPELIVGCSAGALPEVAQADFVFHPDPGYRASPRRSHFVESRQIGEATARSQLSASKARPAPLP